VIVTSSNDAKLERVKSLRATHLINYARVPDWEKPVLALTSQNGVDHILEVVGGRSLGSVNNRPSSQAAGSR
jgi:NADPH:quinone reductase-like Zn-dependent oxidoreductase